MYYSLKFDIYKNYKTLVMSTTVNEEEEKKQNEANLKVEPHILLKYDLIEVKGKGAYGIVWKAKNRENNSIVALKKV